MGEHIERYEEMARKFASNGILVIGMDIRGFGKTFELQDRDLRGNKTRTNTKHPVMKGYSEFEVIYRDLEELV